MAPKPMQRRIDTAPHPLQWVWCYLPLKIMPKGPTPECPQWTQRRAKHGTTPAVVACASMKICLTGTWMKPLCIIRTCAAAKDYVNLHNDGQWVTTPPLQQVTPAPNETQPNKNMDRAPTGNTDMCSP
ncbi:hypothetical protein BS47DRAFT_1368134 [Hydnum rufescens UP504]|uniref:Uncharacterized protein n=1 Tax=Hydnum rufescens UP504 TaxID=1448309 RepID=A0A9P6AGV2_9AGAM|nr:hypothetical protein BS47DRAFT_1368134 [Hydnum rufescens UP504]